MYQDIGLVVLTDKDRGLISLLWPHVSVMVTVTEEPSLTFYFALIKLL